MKYFFGVTLTVVGLLVMLWWGIQATYAEVAGFPWLGAVLVLGGGLMAFAGGLLTAEWDKKTGARRLPVSRILFSVCFVAALALLLIGLWHIFTAGQVFQSLFLAAFGFAGAFISALAALAQDA